MGRWKAWYRRPLGAKQVDRIDRPWWATLSAMRRSRSPSKHKPLTALTALGLGQTMFVCVPPRLVEMASLFLRRAHHPEAIWLLRCVPFYGGAVHKFNIGQTVFLERYLERPLGASGGAYVITKRLPERDGEFEYRIKSVNEPHERAVRESQLKTDL
jgi:hypothetical protein